MAYNLGDLITSVKTRAGDTTIPSSLIIEYLNATQNGVLGARGYTFMETPLTDSLSKSAYSYDLDAEAQTIYYLALMDTTKVASELVYIEHKDWGDLAPLTTVVARPGSFTLFGRSIYFDARADKSYTLSLRYLRRPTTLVKDTDVPDIPEDFRELLIRGALAGVEEWRGNFDLASIHSRKVEDLADDMDARYGVRQSVKSSMRARRSFRNATA